MTVLTYFNHVGRTDFRLVILLCDFSHALHHYQCSQKVRVRKKAQLLEKKTERNFFDFCAYLNEFHILFFFYL